jgi:hypothetical protein
MNSKLKGKVGELEAAKFLASHGFPARRGQQFAGGGDSPDVVCEGLPAFHFEIKRTERTDLYGWMRQARADAAPDRMPVVMHRRNNAVWLVVLDARDFLNLARSHALRELVEQYRNDLLFPNLTEDQRERRLGAIAAALTPPQP